MSLCPQCFSFLAKPIHDETHIIRTRDMRSILLLHRDASDFKAKHNSIQFDADGSKPWWWLCINIIIETSLNPQAFDLVSRGENHDWRGKGASHVIIQSKYIDPPSSPINFPSTSYSIPPPSQILRLFSHLYSSRCSSWYLSLCFWSS